MTATDPRPDLPRTPIRGLAATLAARLAPAAEALALHFESMDDDPETAERKAVRQDAMTKHDIP